jgi:hypothetical protein
LRFLARSSSKAVLRIQSREVSMDQWARAVFLVLSAGRTHAHCHPRLCLVPEAHIARVILNKAAGHLHECFGSQNGVKQSAMMLKPVGPIDP